LLWLQIKDKANECPTKQTYTQKTNDYPTKQTFTFEIVRRDPENKKNLSRKWLQGGFRFNALFGRKTSPNA